MYCQFTLFFSQHASKFYKTSSFKALLPHKTPSKTKYFLIRQKLSLKTILYQRLMDDSIMCHTLGTKQLAAIRLGLTWQHPKSPEGSLGTLRVLWEILVGHTGNNLRDRCVWWMDGEGTDTVYSSQPMENQDQLFSPPEQTRRGGQRGIRRTRHPVS